MSDSPTSCTYLQEKFDEYLPGSPIFISTPAYEFVPKSIFVGGLSPETSEDDVHRAFADIGEIKKVKIIREPTGYSKGFGFVEFVESQCTEVARNLGDASPEINGRQVKIGDAYHRLYNYPKADDYKVATPKGKILSNEGFEYFFPVQHPYRLMGISPPSPYVVRDPNYVKSSESCPSWSKNNAVFTNVFPTLPTKNFMQHQPPTPISAHHNNSGSAFDYGQPMACTQLPHDIKNYSHPMDPYRQYLAATAGSLLYTSYFLPPAQEMQRRVGYQHVNNCEYPANNSSMGRLTEKYARMGLNNSSNNRISYSAKVSGYGTQRNERHRSPGIGDYAQSSKHGAEIGAGDAPPPRYGGRNSNNNKEDRYIQRQQQQHYRSGWFDHSDRREEKPMTPPFTPPKSK